MCRYIKSKISVVITAILTGVLLLTSCNGSTNEQIISMSENNYVKMVSENEDSNIQVKTEPSSNDPGIEPDSVQKHLLYGDELEKYEADIYEKHCAAAYEKRCKMYNLDMSDYSKYNDWSEISVKGDSWKDAYIDLIDEVVGYTVTDYLYGSPYLPCRFLFSLLFLNDDETPELEIDLLLQGEDDRIIYSFDGEKTVFSDCLVENKFVSYYLYKDFILECISDMSECQYTFYNTNDDLKFEEDVTLGYYSTWNEDEGIYEEHYSFSTGPDGEKKEISEKEFFSYFEKKGVDPEDLDKSTAECIFSGKYSEMTKYLKEGVKTTSTETEPIEEDYEGTFSEQMQELSKHIIGYIDADDADEIGPMGTRQHIPEYDEDYYNDMLESGFRNSY